MNKVLRYLEKVYPMLFSVGICMLLYINRNNSIIKDFYAAIFDKDFLTAVLTVASIVFGFLLTAITIIYQSESPVIVELKRAGRFHELIDYNKTAVKCTFYLVLSTSILLMTFMYADTVPYYHCFVGLWVYMAFYACLTNIRFLNIFYSIL